MLNGDIVKVTEGLPLAGHVGEVIDRPDRWTVKVRMSSGNVESFSPADLEHAYGERLSVGCRVEISPHMDAWMRGARFGEILTIDDKLGNVRVKLDKLRKPVTTYGGNLRRIG